MVGHPHVSNPVAHRDMDVGGQQDMTVHDLIKILETVECYLDVVTSDSEQGLKEVTHIAMYVNTKGDVVISLES
jgi:hypothetical protein